MHGPEQGRIARTLEHYNFSKILPRKCMLFRAQYIDVYKFVILSMLYFLTVRHFAIKLVSENFTNFGMPFRAVAKDFIRLD